MLSSSWPTASAPQLNPNMEALRVGLWLRQETALPIKPSSLETRSQQSYIGDRTNILIHVGHQSAVAFSGTLIE